LIVRAVAVIALLVIPSGVAVAVEPTVVSCRFERMPPMILTFRGGMGADDNTLQVGRTPPVPLRVGSNMMIAEYGA